MSAQEFVFIGIGSNMGDKAENCLTSVRHIMADCRTENLSLSSLYRTSPVSYTAQSTFINAAACFIWRDTPLSLLAFLLSIEEKMGRKHIIPKGPRIIDLDILLFRDLTYVGPTLSIPHPELHKRRFALVPCLELDPGLIHPLLRKPLASFLPDIDPGQHITPIDRKEPGYDHRNR